MLRPNKNIFGKYVRWPLKIDTVGRKNFMANQSTFEIWMESLKTRVLLWQPCWWFGTPLDYELSFGIIQKVLLGGGGFSLFSGETENW